ncbi:MAG: lytic murein transglycosylase B [Burkholderiales bacterium]|nr:lytic murein transglycosylase B [Burkholderiales bacterium]
MNSNDRGRVAARWMPALALITGLAAGLSAAPTQAAPHRHARTRAAADPAYGDSAEVRRFADEASARRDLPRAWVAMQVAQAHRIEAVRRLVMPPPPGQAKNWAAYRDRFVEPQRIAAGLAFWRDNARWLNAAQARWGVAPEIVVGIIGVETYFGRITGGFRIIDALATLAFDFPGGRSDRSAFFRDELEQYLVLCAREGVDPQSIRGSYAGAIGLPQFMPGSINRYAVDFDADGHVDLARGAADSIGSVAHYLAESGWVAGMPTRYAVTPPADAAARAALLAGDIVPAWTPAQFTEHGAVLDAAGLRHAGSLALVELHNGQQPPSYVAGTQNFYAVTRYNRSSYYAMAVIELGAAIAAAQAASAP